MHVNNMDFAIEHAGSARGKRRGSFDSHFTSYDSFFLFSKTVATARGPSACLCLCVCHCHYFALGHSFQPFYHLRSVTPSHSHISLQPPVERPHPHIIGQCISRSLRFAWLFPFIVARGRHTGHRSCPGNGQKARR